MPMQDATTQAEPCTGDAGVAEGHRKSVAGSQGRDGRGGSGFGTPPPDPAA